MRQIIAYKSIYYKGDKKDMIQAIPLGIGININKLFSALSKEGKDARRLQATIEEKYKMDEVDELFNKKLVSEVTGLNGTELEDFMFEHRPTYEWIEAAAPYDIIIYIKEKFKVFPGGKVSCPCDMLPIARQFYSDPRLQNKSTVTSKKNES